MSKINLPVVILAAGRGRRMGGVDKAQVLLAGKPLWRHVAEALRPQTLGVIALNAPYAQFDLPILPDDIPDAGPLAGVCVAMDWAAAQGAQAVVTTPVDVPFLPPDFIARLSMAAPFSYAQSLGRAHPLCAHWPVALRHELRAAVLSGARKVMPWVAAAQATVWEGPPDPFLNINSAQDLIRAE